MSLPYPVCSIPSTCFKCGLSLYSSAWLPSMPSLARVTKAAGTSRLDYKAIMRPPAPKISSGPQVATHPFTAWCCPSHLGVTKGQRKGLCSHVQEDDTTINKHRVCQEGVYSRDNGAETLRGDMLLCSYEAGKHRENLAPWDSAWFGLSTHHLLTLTWQPRALI